MNDNKKIAVNTTILYFKLLINIILGLYTSRLVLQALGAEDFGLYAVVGGIVSLMNFLGTTMIATSYRFIAVELGKGEKGNPNKIYNTVLIIHIILALLLLAIGETIGIFYIENFLNVPPEKIGDALYVLHWSLIATIFVVLSIPSNGLIVAKEKFVFISIIETTSTILKFIAIIYLAYYNGNKLRMYAIIMAIFNVFIPICYTIYCHFKEYKTAKWHFNKSTKDYKEIIKYAFWIMLGATACIAQTQGAAILINRFFTTITNAAFGIASQVNNYVLMFVRNLSQATVPQIMKSYSAGNQERSMTLVYNLSKYSFFLMLLPTLPLLISINAILKLWLGDVPKETNIFTNLMLINGLVGTLGGGFDACIQSTGKIRKNQIGFSLISVLLIPITFILYKLNMPSYSIAATNIVTSIAIILFQMKILITATSFKVSEYLRITLFYILKVLVIVIPISLILYKTFSDSIHDTFIKIAICGISILLSIYYLGLSAEEKQIITKIITNIQKKVKVRIIKNLKQ